MTKMDKATMKLCKKYAKQLLPIFKAFAEEYMQRICKDACTNLKCSYETKIKETAIWFIISNFTAMFCNYSYANVIRLLKLFKNALYECEDLMFDTAENIEKTQKEGDTD